MARKRRRRGSAEDDATPAEPSATPDPEPEARAEAEADSLDSHCLTHPALPVSTACDACGEPICAMCALAVRAETLCPACFSDAVRARRFHTSTWQGWAAAGASLAALTIASAPFALPDLTTRPVLLGYVAAAFAAAAVFLGFSAQDFPGATRRAGAVGIVFGTLTLVAVIALNILALLTQKN